MVRHLSSEAAFEDIAEHMEEMMYNVLGKNWLR